MGINKPLKATFGFDFLIGKSVGGNTACGIGNINRANLVAVNIVCLNKPDIFYFAPPLFTFIALLWRHRTNHL